LKVVALNKISFYLSLKFLPKTDQSILIKNKIHSLKFSKKHLRVNFYYSLKINKLNLLQKGSGQVGVGGGILEKRIKIFLPLILPI